MEQPNDFIYLAAPEKISCQSPVPGKPKILSLLQVPGNKSKPTPSLAGEGEVQDQHFISYPLILTLVYIS